jgi:hypothetical protein
LSFLRRCCSKFSSLIQVLGRFLDRLRDSSRRIQIKFELFRSLSLIDGNFLVLITTKSDGGSVSLVLRFIALLHYGRRVSIDI